MLRRLLLAALVVSLGATPALAKRAAAPPPAPPEPPLEELIASARAAGKPLLIDFYTDWCKPCRMFEEKILPDAGVQAALGDVMFVRYDAEKGNGVPAATRYRVDSYPNFVLIDGQGKAIARSSGTSEEPAPFVTFVGRSLALALDEATVSARVKDKKSDARALLGAARWLAAHRRADEAVAVYARAARADKGGKAGVAPVAEWEAFSLEHGRSFRKKVAEDAAAFVEKWPAAPNAAEAALFAIRSGQMAPARAKKLWAILLQRTWNQPGALNSLAYSALAAGDHDAALLAAQRAVELSPKDAAVYDTLAEVHHYRGDKDKAVAASDQGIALAQDASFASALKVNRDRFAGGGGADKAPGPDVEAEKTRAEAEVEEFVRGGAAEDIAVEDDAPPSPEEAAKIEAEQQMRVLQRGATDAFKTASSKCAAQANGLNEAWVRVELTPRGGKPVKVLVIEPGVSAGLKKCLTDSLAQTSFPAAPKAANGRFTGAVKFPR